MEGRGVKDGKEPDRKDKRVAEEGWKGARREGGTVGWGVGRVLRGKPRKRVGDLGGRLSGGSEKGKGSERESQDKVFQARRGRQDSFNACFQRL